MAKDATVSARIDETLKSQAEEILQQLGIPVSVVINTLYHQIVIQKGVPFPLTLNRSPATLEGMSSTQLNAKLEHSYQQAITRQGSPLNDVFADLERKHT